MSLHVSYLTFLNGVLLTLLTVLVLTCEITNAQATPTNDTPPLGITAIDTSTQLLTTTTAGANAILDTSFGGCPPPLVPNIRKLETRSCHGSCCLPCPASSLFYEPGQMDILRTSTCIIRSLSCLSMIVLTISYLILPGRRQHPHLIILFKFITIAIWEGMGVMWLTRRRSLICYDDVLVSTMSNTPICGFQGVALVYLVGMLFVQGITLVANLHCLAVYRSLRVQKQVSKLIALSFVLPLALIIPPALQQKFSFSGYGSICFMSADMVNQFFFYPVGAMMIASVTIHLSTVIYMAYFTGKNYEQSNATTSSSGNSQIKRQRSAQTARDITRMLKQQWRPGIFAMCQLLVYFVYFIFYFAEIKKFGSINATADWFQEWMACLGQQAIQNIQKFATSTPMSTLADLTSPANVANLGNAGQRSCLPIVRPHVPVFWKLVMSDMAPAVFGICIFLIFGTKYELWHDWHTFFHEKVLHRESSTRATFNMVKSPSIDSSNSDANDNDSHDKERDGAVRGVRLQKPSISVVTPMTFEGEPRPSFSQRQRNLGTRRYNSHDNPVTAGAMAAGYKTSLEQYSKDDDGFVPYQPPSSLRVPVTNITQKVSFQESPSAAASNDAPSPFNSSSLSPRTGNALTAAASAASAARPTQGGDVGRTTITNKESTELQPLNDRQSQFHHRRQLTNGEEDLQEDLSIIQAYRQRADCHLEFYQDLTAISEQRRSLEDERPATSSNSSTTETKRPKQSSA